MDGKILTMTHAFLLFFEFLSCCVLYARVTSKSTSEEVDSITDSSSFFGVEWGRRPTWYVKIDAPKKMFVCYIDRRLSYRKEIHPSESKTRPSLLTDVF